MKQMAIHLLLLMFFAVQGTRAQTSGNITGVVMDDENQAQQGVHVFIPQTPYATTTAADGSFEIQNVPVGDYQLSVTKIGFEQQQLSIVVSHGEAVDLKITLVISTYHLGEVSVYGQKRRTIYATRVNAPLEQTPLSMNIVPQELLQQQQAISLENALINVSGVSKFGSYGLSDNINIRGFDIGLSGGSENYRVNGLMVRTPYSDYVEEVQVLKGPASILYGDVEPGGIINFVTKKPLGYNHASLEFKLGEYGLYRPSVDLGGKLADNISYRLNTVFETSDSFRDEVFNQQFMIAPTVFWDIGDKTSLNVEALLMNNEVTIDWGMPVGLSLERAKQLDRSNFYGYRDGTSEGGNNMITATFVHEIFPKWEIRNTLGYSNQSRLIHDVYPVFNASTDSVEFSFGDYREKSRTNTFSNFLDLTGNVNTGAFHHRILLGVDVSDVTRPVASNSVFPIPITTSLENPAWENTGLSSTPVLDDDILPFTTRLGINAQDLVSVLDDRLNLLVGVRFSQFTTGTRYRGDAEEPEDNSNTTESRLTPRIGLTYEVVDGITLYGSYAESFSSVAPQPGRGLEDPEPLIGDQVEFGVKSSLLEDRLGITLSYFDLNRKNVLQFEIIDQNGNISDPGNFRANQSGEHNSKGVELDINGKLLRNWQVFAAFSYFETEVIRELVQRGDAEPVDFAGKELPNNPNTKLSIWTQYTLTSGIPGLFVGAGIFHQGDMFGDRLNTAENVIEGFTQIDAMVGYQYKNVKFQLNARNINDIETFQRSIFGTFVPQSPRTIIASIAYEL